MLSAPKSPLWEIKVKAPLGASAWKPDDHIKISSQKGKKKHIKLRKNMHWWRTRVDQINAYLALEGYTQPLEPAHKNDNKEIKKEKGKKTLSWLLLFKKYMERGVEGLLGSVAVTVAVPAKSQDPGVWPFFWK